LIEEIIYHSYRPPSFQKISGSETGGKAELRHYQHEIIALGSMRVVLVESLVSLAFSGGAII
jgi:hypothetical protein